MESLSKLDLRDLFTGLVVVAVVLLCVTTVEASVGRSIPQIANLMDQITGTVTGPIGTGVFMMGVVKAGGNVYKQGGISGLAEGGMGVACAGALIGGGPWLATQLGVTGALVP
jgi:type IV secretory pathway VirB2 component (pilin)